MYDQVITTLALTMGVAWASGINLYATIAVVGAMGRLGEIDLPTDLEVLENEIVIAAAALMYFVEFFIDKVPGLDTGWDTIHTFIRIPAGAILAAGAIGDVSPAMQVVAGILGAGATTSSHATKAGTRVLINTSPEPFTNWTASVTEDVAVFGGLWAALNHPWVFVSLFLVWVILLIWLLPKLWRGIKKVFSWLARMLGAEPDPAPLGASPSDDASSLNFSGITHQADKDKNGPPPSSGG